MMTINNVLTESNSFRDGCFDSLLIILKNSFQSPLNDNLPCREEHQEESESVWELLKLGLNCMAAGISPSACRLMLDFHFIKICSIQEISEEELMKLLLLKELIPLVQQNMVEEFIAIAAFFCSNHINKEIFELQKLVRFTSTE